MLSQNRMQPAVSFLSATSTLAQPVSLLASPYEIMVQDGKVHDIDYEDEDRW
jgi:hypothetical protein